MFANISEGQLLLYGENSGKKVNICDLSVRYFLKFLQR